MPTARFQTISSGVFALLFACAPTDRSGGSGELSTSSEGSSTESGDNPPGSTSDEPDPGTTGGDGTGDTGTRFDLGDGGPTPPPETGPIETCEDAQDARTSIGCEFLGARFPNWADQMSATPPAVAYAVGVANVSPGSTASVSVESKTATGWVPLQGPVSVAPLDLHLFELNVPAVPEDVGVATGHAVRVVADRPVVAYQFNPLDGGSQSTDASLLYPTSSWDHLNLGAAYETRSNASTNLLVVAAHDGTEIRVHPSREVEGGNGVPGAVPGGSFDVRLNAGDVANIGPKAIYESLSGTWIETDPEHPVGVFASNPCTTVPSFTCCCDHLEEQIPGLRTWGQDIVAPQLPLRNAGAPEGTMWEIYASEDGTEVDFDAAPGVQGLVAGPVTLDRGETLRMEVSAPPGTPGDFVVHASHPVLVNAFMLSASESAVDDMGDPAMVAIPPAQQFLTRQVVLVPPNWDNDFLVVLRPQGVPVRLDGAEVAPDLFRRAGTSEWEIARIPVPDGVHVLDGGEEPVGVVVVGYDLWDSYAYTGGTGAAVLNPDPTPPVG